MQENQSLRNVWIGIAMLLTAWAAVAMKPTVKIADQGEKVNLEVMIPKQFGDWQIDPTIVPIQVSEERKILLKKLYNQTLSRTYYNAQGQRVMLSIAYGGDQSDSMQVHKPEVCYQAQGFDVLKITASEMLTEYGKIPIKRLLAVQGRRNEPITYWFTVGNSVATSGLDFKLRQLRYGLTGKIPDGLLFRVSTIDPNESQAYAVQDAFVHDLLKVISPKDRLRLIGAL